MMLFQYDLSVVFIFASPGFISGHPHKYASLCFSMLELKCAPPRHIPEAECLSVCVIQKALYLPASAEEGNVAINDSRLLKCFCYWSSTSISYSVLIYVLSKSLCEHLFQLDHCRSKFFFQSKIHSGAKHSFIRQLHAGIPVWPFLIYSSILKYTKAVWWQGQAQDKCKSSNCHFFFLSTELMSPLHSNSPVYLPWCHIFLL